MFSNIYKFYFVIFSLLFLITITSCNQSNKLKNTTNQFDITGKKYSIVPETTSIFWTGYKTTEKIPVKGQFMKLNIDNIKKTSTVREAIDGLEFTIPVSSLFSNEESRDAKLKEFLFGIMEQTELLSGKIAIENDTLAIVSLKMNAITKTIPLTYFIDGQMLSMRGKIDLTDWNALDALASLHKVCKDKHTGDDGISKTWNDVGINVESYLKLD